MVGKENLKAEDLNLCFEKLMMLGGSARSGGGKVKMEAGVITEWKDIPMELLLQIVSIVDDKTVIVASGVCRGWRDAICMGHTHLSFSWYMFFLSLSLFFYETSKVDSWIFHVTGGFLGLNLCRER